MLLALACNEPQVDPLRAAVLSFQAGKEALSQGDPQAAAEAFGQAQALDPQSAELALWHGQALAEAGDLPGAIAQADRAVSLRPGLVEGWYNRACWKARAGDLEGAASDLAQALRSPELDPLSVAVDPDLQALREHPEFASVMPSAELPLAAELDPGPHFLGAELELRLTLDRGGELSPSLSSASEPSALMRPTAVIQDLDPNRPGALGLRVRFKALGPGEVTLGPITAQAGALQGHSEALGVQLLAPPDTPTPTQVAWAPIWSLPASLLTGEPGARAVQGWCLVELQPGDRARWEATDVVEVELREGTRVLRRGLLGQSEAGAPVVIERAGQTTWSGSCP